MTETAPEKLAEPRLAASPQGGRDEVLLQALEAARDSARASAGWQDLRDRMAGTAMRIGKDDLSFDFRRLLTDPDMLAAAGELMWALARPFEPDVLIGPGFGASPLLSAMVLRARAEGRSVRFLMVRDQRKAHNQRRWVEGGAVPVGARAVFVDDFMEAGSAVRLVERALRADKVRLRLLGALLFFDMWAPLGSRQLSLGRLPVVSLFRRHDLGLSRDCFDAQPPLMKGNRPDFVAEPLWWRFELNRSAEVTGHAWRSSPAVAEGAVFAADDQSRVWRHDAADGRIAWRRDSLWEAPKGIVQRLTAAAGSVVYGAYDGTLTRLNAASGDVIWRWRQGSSVHSTPELDLDRGRLFVNTEQWRAGPTPFGFLQALDWRTGRALWSVRHGHWPPGSPAYHRASDTVVASCNDRSLIGVDATSGDVRWRQRTAGLVRGKPGLADDRVVVATESGHLSAFDMRDGANLWSVRYGRSMWHQFVHVQDGLAFAVDGKWNLLAFDLHDGRLRWASRLRAPCVWGPVPFGRWLVCLSRGGELAVLEPARQRKVWEGRIAGDYRQPPALGHVEDGALLAAASGTSGLRVFRVHPFYTEA